MTLPPGWALASIGEVVQAQVDQRVPGNQLVRYIDIGSIDRDSKRVTATKQVNSATAPTRARQWVRRGDVLVSMTRPNLNAVAIITSALDGAVASTGFDVLRAIDILPEWVFHRVRTHTFVHDVCEDVQGVVYPAIRPDDVRRHVLPIAPLDEQRRIVDAIDSYLSRLDAAVASLQRAQAKLKAYRASALKTAVEGRLVPTEAELARAEKRDYEPADVLLKRILVERRRRWEEAELARLDTSGKALKDDKRRTKYQEPAGPDTSMLPDLPEGWCWTTWAQVGTSQNGRAFPSKEYQTEGIRLLRPGNLHDSGRVVWNKSNTKHMPSEWAHRYPDHIVEGRELVMNLTAQSLKDEFLGRTCLTAFSERCLLNQRIARLTPMLVSERYMLWIIKSPWFRRFVGSLNTGSLIQHMFTSQLEELAIPLPPVAEQDRIADEIERLLAVEETLLASITANEARMVRLRQAVLKWAFEGKLVDQTPSDKPAGRLLDGIRARRVVSASQKTPRKRRTKSAL